MGSTSQDCYETQVCRTTVYCAGCNERFMLAAGVHVCPRCGTRVAPADEVMLDETVLIKRRHDEYAVERDDSSFRDEDAEALIGATLGVYRCESLLGVGGMGRVYLASHTDLGRRCALKILSPKHAAADTDYVARFSEEGRAAAALVHPNIVTTHAIGRTDDYHFLEMEFVAGRSLQQLIDDEGALTPLRAMSLITQSANGLAAAHREGIIHRDLKPDNILLTRRGIPKLSDFGLAKRVMAGQHAVETDVLCGTPHFMAPELLRGDKATPTSDVYALGVCLFLMLTGRLPFAASSLNELMGRVATEPVPNIRDERPEVSLEIAECVGLLLDRSLKNRPRDAIEASQWLHAMLGESRDIESLLIEAFHDDSHISWTRTDKRYRVSVALPGNRQQTLFVEPSEHAVATERLLLIYSTCCKAQPEYFEEALRLNSQIPHGSLAIREIDGESQFVAIDTYPRATVDPEEIRRSILEVATQADAVEKLLTGLDRH